MTHLEIEAFFEIIKAGSISSASKNLYVTQPALSRRIKTLEEELGYSLFERKKGQRNTELTEKGEAFIAIAHKWMNIWQEAREINHLNSSKILNISSIGSVSSYILPEVFRRFLSLNQEVRICFHNYHSFEAYRYVESGVVDLAFISDDMYCKNVETIPAFQETMMVAANVSTEYSEKVSPRQLDPGREIRLPWNPEYDTWHDYWFKSTPEFSVSLDQMSLLEYFLSGTDAWAIVPASVAARMSGLDYVKVCELEDGPPQRIIYYLKGGSKKRRLINHFLELLEEELCKIPGLKSYIRRTDPSGVLLDSMAINMRTDNKKGGDSPWNSSTN